MNKWYFDELIDLADRAPGRRRRALRERHVRAGVRRRDASIGGTTGLVRAGSAAVRAVQSGFVRYYAALLVLGVAGVGFYFLLQA